MISTIPRDLPIAIVFKEYVINNYYEIPFSDRWTQVSGSGIMNEVKYHCS